MTQPERPFNPTCRSCADYSRDLLRGQFLGMCWRGGKGRPAPMRICSHYRWKDAPARPVQLKLEEAA